MTTSLEISDFIERETVAFLSREVLKLQANVESYAEVLSIAQPATAERLSAIALEVAGVVADELCAWIGTTNPRELP